MNVYVFVSTKEKELREWLENGVGAVQGLRLVKDPDHAEIFLVGEYLQLRLLYGMGIAQEKQVILILIRKDGESPRTDQFPANLHLIELSEEKPVPLCAKLLIGLKEVAKKLNAVPA